MIAFSISGTLIHTAFTQWANDPILTTLDTIAAPIDNVQFPTVTACSDYKRNPPNNWAIIENTLNLVHFDCRKTDKDCESINSVHEDFEFLIKPVIGMFKKWLINPDNVGYVSEKYCFKI